MHGWSPLVARSGTDALALADGADVVVTDFCMPEMDGLELLRAIRRGRRGTPVIVLTAHRSDAFADHARRAGALEVVAKPFDIDALALAIERALEVCRAGPRST
jgi:two-component system, NtrC family, response regulator AtoC